MVFRRSRLWVFLGGSLLLWTLGCLVQVGLAQVQRRSSSALVWPLVVPPQEPAPVAALRSYRSEHYVIHTDLPRAAVVPYGRHADRMYREYRQRLTGYGGEEGAPMPLYLFQTRAAYRLFLEHQGVPADHSAGMFFVRGERRGLALFLEEKTPGQVFAVLQHEGFHQFAWQYLSPALPVWVNEGLAQYFEDGVFTERTVYLGQANARRIRLVRSAIEQGQVMPLQELFAVSGDSWSHALQHHTDRSALLYAQAWSVVHFLVHGHQQRYRQPLDQYLRLISTGRDPAVAFREAFGATDVRTLEHRWLDHARHQQPDALAHTVLHMEVLGAALRHLKEENERMPRSIADLRQQLRRRGFVLQHRTPGVALVYHADQEDLFRYRRANGSVGELMLLEAAHADLPPRLRAPGLRPEPTLTWARDEQGRLMPVIEFQ